MDLSCCDAAEGEVGGQLAAEVGAEQAVARFFVVCHAAARHEVVEPL